MRASTKYLSIGVILFSIISCNQKKAETKTEIKKEIVKTETIELLVGTYTDESSKGIYKLMFNPTDGTIENTGLVAETVSPSYFTISKDKQFVYSVNESDPGNISSYKWNTDRTKLNLISNLPSEGRHPCYAEINGNENLLAIANYSSGNLSVYSIVNGEIQDSPQTRQHEGSGSVKSNQDAPHAHCAKFDINGKFIYVADLGIDEIVAYSVDKDGKLGEKQIALATDKGDGPRHIIFHPSKDIAFIINELSGSVISAKVNHETGVFEKIDKESTLPEDYTGKNSCADIHITSNGKFLYASNRGHNTIAVFSVSENGELERLATTSVEGDWPRNFTLSPDEKFLLVANKSTDNITIFSINQETGLLTFTGNEVSISRPICLKF